VVVEDGGIHLDLVVQAAPAAVQVQRVLERQTQEEAAVVLLFLGMFLALGVQAL
jgi:hypothetical protein